MTTTDTDAMPSNQPMLSAQSDPVELYHKLIDVTEDFGKALDACVEYRDQLAASSAVVERLKEELAAWDYGTRAKREQERAEKAEAEVERLTDAIKSCWHAANTYDGKYARACDNVMTISSEALDPTDK